MTSEEFKLEQDKFEWQQKQDSRGFSFRTYIVPTMSVITTVIVAYIGWLAYTGQENSKRSELELAGRRLQLDFLEKERKAYSDARIDFDAFIEKKEQSLGSASMKQRVFDTKAIISRYANSTPSLVIDFFRKFRDTLTPEKRDDACEGNLEACTESSPDYSKRAALMNYVRTEIHGRFTVYVYGKTVKEPSMEVRDILVDEQFTIGATEDPAFDSIVKKMKGYHPHEIWFFHEEDQIFAQTIADRLSSADSERKINYGKIFCPDPTFGLQKQIVVVGD